ncbi:hypothetical protein BsWGS_15673 [Bradybaena similaris]
MKESTRKRKNGIQWTLWTQLGDFADDLALLYHNRQQMQEKADVVSDRSAQAGLNIHREKSKMLKIIPSNNDPVMISGSPLEEVQSFTYPGSIIDQQSDLPRESHLTIRVIVVIL